MLEKFKTYLLKEKRSSELTVNAYLKDVSAFLDFSELDASNLSEINYQIIRSWIVYLIDEGLTNRSVNRKLSSLRTFFKWAKRNNFIELDPMIRVKGPKQQKRLPEFVKKDEITPAHLDPIFGDDIFSFRDRLMIEVFYQTGIRLTELVNLKESDITNDSFKVIGKRNKERIIPISNELVKELKKLNKMKADQGIDCFHIFFTNKGEKLYPKFVYRKINHYLSLITSLGKRSPHVLRHSFATHMLNNGAGLETLKELLGHANLSATQVYTHNSFDEINKVYKQAHPRGHKEK